MKRLLLITLLIIAFLRPYAAGKINLALLGDSMTWIGGENFDKPNGWPYYIKDMPLNMRLYARSGATWTNTQATDFDIDAYSEIIDPQNVIYNQVQRLIHDNGSFQPEIILIYAGANDAWFSQLRPGIFDDDNLADILDPAEALPSEFTSLEGSIRLSTMLLKSAFPEAAILFLTPVYSGKIPDNMIEKVGDCIEATGRTLNVKVIRGDKLIPFSSADEQPGNLHLTYDGVHSNSEGAKAIADCIRQHILQSTD